MHQEFGYFPPLVGPGQILQKAKKEYWNTTSCIILKTEMFYGGYILKKNAVTGVIWDISGIWIWCQLYISFWISSIVHPELVGRITIPSGVRMFQDPQEELGILYLKRRSGLGCWASCHRKPSLYKLNTIAIGQLVNK